MNQGITAALFFIFLNLSFSVNGMENFTDIFLEMPPNLEVSVGDTFAWQCVSTKPLDDCQWLWFNDTETPVVVKQFKAYERNKTFCSVLFLHATKDQEGSWICAIKPYPYDKYIKSEPANLIVKEKSIKIVEISNSMYVEEQDSVHLICKTSSEVSECQWIWRDFNKTDSDVVETFTPLGKNKSDCSLQFSNIQAEQEGLWICGVKVGETEFSYADPVNLTVSKAVKFLEVSNLLNVQEQQAVNLTCKLQSEVAECQWIWNDFNMTKNIEVKRFSPKGENESDCSLMFSSIHKEQEGFWTCGAKRFSESSFQQAFPINLNVTKSIEFVQLSQDIQIAEGEAIMLRCVTNIPVAKCRWTFQRLNMPDTNPLIFKEFPPTNNNRDCSIRFKSMLIENEGIWRCGVWFPTLPMVEEAAPAIITLIPPVKLRFIEKPEDVSVPVGDPASLICVSASEVEECQWLWKPLNQIQATTALIKSFEPKGKFKRNCSINFTSVLREQEGYWGCKILSSSNLTSESAFAKLLPYEPKTIHFNHHSENIQMPIGGPLLLQCETEEPIEKCQWLWNPFNNTKHEAIQEFLPSGENKTICNLELPTVLQEHEGLWTCGVRNKGENKFINNTPYQLRLLRQGSAMIALWSTQERKVTLACQIKAQIPETICYWQHLPETIISQDNQTQRYIINQNRSGGACSLIFHPGPEDLGQWRCVFVVETPIGDFEVADANIILLATLPDKEQGWVVGSLTAIILLLIITLVVILVYKCRNSKSQDTSTIGYPSSKENEKYGIRYTNSPSKIHFEFEEIPNQAIQLPHSPPPSSHHHHIYERVDHFNSSVTHKGTYENVS